MLNFQDFLWACLITLYSLVGGGGGRGNRSDQLFIGVQAADAGAKPMYQEKSEYPASVRVPSV